MRKFIIALMLLTICSTAYSQELTDWNKRLQISANGGALWFSRTGAETDNWRGADLGGSVTYSLHQAFSVYGIYSHGFPLEGADGHANFVQLIGNLKVYPSSRRALSEDTEWAVFVGGGKGWFGFDNNIKDFSSYEAQLVVARKLGNRVAAYGKYGHSFVQTGTDEPGFDLVRAGLTTLLFP